MKRKLLLFTVVGGIQYVVDTSVFALLILLSAPVIISNPLSRASGAIIGYTLNHKWTFVDQSKDSSDLLRPEPMARYVIYWLVMTTLSTYAIHMIGAHLNQEGYLMIIVAKLLIEIVLFIISFLFGHFWVYR